MFPKNEMFCFYGSVRNVIHKQSLQSIDDPVYTDTKQLYLGKFLQSNVLLWSNDKIIIDGLAVFEYGCIRFPDYRHVKIWTGKAIDHSHLQSLPMYKVYDNDLSCHQP